MQEKEQPTINGKSEKIFLNGTVPSLLCILTGVGMITLAQFSPENTSHEFMNLDGKIILTVGALTLAQKLAIIRRVLP